MSSQNDTGRLSLQTRSSSTNRGAGDAANIVNVADHPRKASLAFPPLTQDDLEDIQIASKEKCLTGLFRTSFVLLIAAIALIMANYGFNFGKIVSIAVGSVYVAYLVHIWYIFCSAEEMFRIYTLSKIPDDWLNMSIAFSNRQARTEPMTSISEFSAIAGGAGKGALQKVGTISWLSALFIALFRVHGSGFRAAFFDGIFFELIGAFGIDVIGTFFLDPYSKLMRTAHYCGVLCCMGTLVGLWIQTVNKTVEIQYYVLTSILTAQTLIFFGLFSLYYPYLYNPNQKEMAKPEVVTSISRKILMFETLGLGSAALAFVLFLWFDE